MHTVLEKEDRWFRSWFKQFVIDLNADRNALVPSEDQDLNNVSAFELRDESMDIENPEQPSTQDRMVCVTTGNQSSDWPFLYIQNASALLGSRNRSLIIKMVLHFHDENIEKENKWSNKIRDIMNRGCALADPHTMTRFTECKMEKPITDKKIRQVKLEFLAQILWK